MVLSYLNSVSNSLGLNYVTSLIYGHGAGCKEQLLKESSKSGTASAIMQNCGRNFVRLAGISGALAVGLGAYGAHVFSKQHIPEELKQVYDTANRYHLIHTVALVGVPLARKPQITGTLISLGMLLFCGSCYVHALTGYQPIRQVTPFGGVLLMLGWLSLVL